MRWRDGSVSKYCSLFSFLLFFGVLLVPFSVNAVTEDTEVDVLICHPDNSAQLTIESPPSDSTTSQPQVTIRGQALSTSQIEIHVDGEYDKTMAIPKGRTDFETNVNLAPGTHTIAITAIDICGGNNDTKNIVITYRQPPGPGPSPDAPDSPSGSGGKTGSGKGEATISHGSDVPTDLPGEATDSHGEREVWPLSYASDGSILSFVIRALIAFIGAFLLSLRPRHIARVLHQNVTTSKWPLVICLLLWLIGILLVLFSIFGI